MKKWGNFDINSKHYFNLSFSVINGIFGSEILGMRFEYDAIILSMIIRITFFNNRVTTIHEK